MDKKKIQTLALNCYNGKNLDQRKIKLIANRLNRRDLKEFISELRNEESKRTVTVILPIDNILNPLTFSKMFPDKLIIYKTDPSLIAGVKIIDNDQIFEFDLKNTFENLVNHIKESYD